MRKLFRWPPALVVVIPVLVTAGFLVAVLTSPAGQPDPQWDVTARQLLEGTLEGPVARPAPVPDNPRRAGVYAGLLIAALLSILYGYTHRRYVVHWAGAWVLLSFSMYTIARSYETADGARLAVGLLELAKVGIALLLYRSAHLFNRTIPYTKRDWLLLPALLAWLIIAYGRVSVPIALAPAYLICGVIHSRTAWLFGSAFVRRRTFGAFLLAASLALVGTSNFVFGAFFAQIMGSAAALLPFLTSNSLAFLVAAFGMMLLVFEELTAELRTSNRELETAQEELKRLATVDALTGCYNRHFFDQNIGHELQRHSRYGMPLSVLFVDVDRFKSINDTFGHETGDRVLQHVGAFLRRHIRDADYVIRWGGDEFLVLLTCPGPEAGRKVALLKHEFERTGGAEDLPAGLTFSVGYTEVPSGVTDILPFIHNADRNMYADKTGVI